jgi:class 3 adenylate cyclase
VSELPRGTVTFLFTDIEGSTQLVKQLGGRYSEVLAEHQRILRAAFVAHGRREVWTRRPDVASSGASRRPTGSDSLG